jgi:hypothetical protein
MPSERDKPRRKSTLRFVWRVVLAFALAAIGMILLGFVVVAITVFRAHNHHHGEPLRHRYKTETRQTIDSAPESFVPSEDFDKSFTESDFGVDVPAN